MVGFLAFIGTSKSWFRKRAKAYEGKRLIDCRPVGQVAHIDADSVAGFIALRSKCCDAGYGVNCLSDEQREQHIYWKHFDGVRHIWHFEITSVQWLAKEAPLDQYYNGRQIRAVAVLTEINASALLALLPDGAVDAMAGHMPCFLIPRFFLEKYGRDCGILQYRVWWKRAQSGK